MRTRFLLVAGLAGALVLPPRPAAAYRPFDGTDADVADPMVFELELGPVHYERVARQNYLFAPALVLNLGVGGETEVVVDANDVVAVGPLEPGVSRVALLGDDVLVKHVFVKGALQDKPGVSIAAEGGVLTPEIHGDDGFGASLDVIASDRWAWGAVHWNEWFEYTRAHRPDLFSGVILEGPHDWAVRPVGEAFFDVDFGVDTTESILVGAIWEATEVLAIDVGLRLARSGPDDEAEVRLGLTWSVPLGPRREDPAAHQATARPHRRM